MPGSLAIDAERMRADFDALAEIGSTGDGGVHRPALGEHHLAARKWFLQRAREASLETRIDGAGNHSAILSSARPGARTLLLGSHLDSVPRGGRFDGALGVVAALEAVRAVAEAGVDPGVHLEAIDFTDEEGTLVGLLGSRAVAGTLSAAALERPRCGSEAFAAALARADLTADSILAASREADGLAGFLEIHIEQGPRLVDGRMSIGIVRGIAGIVSFAITLRGRPDHAGTTPLRARRDAGLGAARLVVALQEAVARDFDDGVINCGRLRLSPNAYNIVPGEAELGVEFRAADAERLAEMETSLEALVRGTADDAGLEVEIDKQGCIPPTPCAAEVRAAFTAACRKLDLRSIELTSGAGHDTGALQAVCPSGMIFVPSTGGSHSPREHAEWRDCVNGAEVLLQAALRRAADLDDPALSPAG